MPLMLTTAVIMGFQAHDFYFRRSEDNNLNDDDFKAADAAGLVINDIAERASEE